MKQAYFAALDRLQAASLPMQATSMFQSNSHSLPLSVTGEIRPCAASVGVSYEQLVALSPVVGYQPPSHLHGKAPTNLALLQTTAAGRLLCHGALAPAANGVPSHSFTHVLLDIPSTLDAHQAIQAWGSSQWQQSAAEGLGQLSDALIPPVSVELNDQALTSFLAEEKQKHLFQVILAAVMSTPADATIFVAAPSEMIALCIYGLTRALPSTFMETFTFCTYTHNPLDTKARVVGTEPESEDQELPHSCYDGAGVGVNYYTGTKTSLDIDLPFVEFAVQVLASGNHSPLDDFRATWQRLGIRDMALVDMVYRLGRGPDAITKDEAIKALQDTALASWIAPRAEYQQLFLQWALDDIDFATVSFPRVATALRQRPDHLAKLATQIHDAGWEAVKAGNLTTSRCALEVLLPMVSPVSGQAIWGDLLKQQADPEALSWEMRCYLLPKLTRLRPLTVGQEADADIRRWLNVPADKLSAFLGLSLSQGHHVAACLQAINQSKSNLPSVGKALAGNQPMALVVLQQLLANPEGKGTAHELYAELVREEPQPSWLNELFKLDPPVPASVLNRCLGTSLDQGVSALDPIPFIKQHGTSLLERLGGQGNLDRLAALVLAGQAGDLLQDPAMKSFLLGLEGKSGMSGPVEERLSALLQVHRYLEQPTVRPDHLTAVSRAMQLEPPLFGQATKQQLLQAALSSMGSTTFQDELVSLLLNWGKLFGGPSALYRECLKISQQHKAFWKNQDQLQAFLAVALDGTTSEMLNTETEGLEAEAYFIVENLVRRGGKKAWQEMDARLVEWPRPAKRQWQFLSQAVMPQQARGLGRDLLAAIIGAVITAVVFFALRWWGVI